MRRNVRRVIPEPSVMMAAFGLVLVFLSSPATAQSALRPLDRMAADNPVVVELFTSQGCASCPPADDVLRELAQIEGVLPLALHVDYWDYIGWQDTFGSPLFTARQQAYARAAGERMIYTPQMIIAGSDRVLGSDPVAVMAFINAHAARPAPVVIDLEAVADKLHVSARTPMPFARPVIVHLVHFLPQETVAIPVGENAGQVFDYVNIVTGWQMLGEWDGREPLALDVDGAEGLSTAVLVQEPGPGAILAAARMH